jgi:hypothetical protein
VGPVDYRSASDRTQEATGHFRQRRCLLKGCEQPFCPSRPQARYCSEACRQEARRWRRWRSSRTYRASASGKRCRRGQACRYRERQRQQRVARQAEMAEATARATARAAVVQEVQEASQLEEGEPREGQRPAAFAEDFVGQPCARPGCYVLFPLRPGVPQQRYCSCQCRQALRRVLDREARWRCRHWPGRRWRGSRPPPW